MSSGSGTWDAQFDILCIEIVRADRRATDGSVGGRAEIARASSPGAPQGPAAGGRRQAAVAPGGRLSPPPTRVAPMLPAAGGRVNHQLPDTLSLDCIIV